MIKVFHVQIGEEHYYFGSKKAIFDNLDKSLLGIGYTSFRNIKNLDKVPYHNKKCIIREGVLVQAVSSRNRSEDSTEADPVSGE